MQYSQFSNIPDWARGGVSSWKGLKTEWGKNSNWRPQFCYVFFLFHSLSLSQAASLKGIVTKHTWNCTRGLKRMSLSYNWQVTPGRQSSRSKFQNYYQVRVCIDLDIQTGFPYLSCLQLPQIFPWKRCCQTHNQVRYMHTHEQSFVSNNWINDGKKDIHFLILENECTFLQGKKKSCFLYYIHSIFAVLIYPRFRAERLRYFVLVF